MTHTEIRKKFRDFFESREKLHKWRESSSLLPDDPSVLLTTAGMQQFKLYYTGEADAMKDFGSLNTVSIQKSFRTSDIDEVGDESHLTFFEMMGNFSFGGYWKKEAIQYAHDFITQEMGLKISYVTVFQGNDVVPKDEESKEIWKSFGVTDIREEGMDDVFWGPTGNSGPCGPTTEIYCKNSKGQDIEIWNIVFNEFFCDSSRDSLLKGEAKLKPLEKKGIDTGMGLERLAMISQEKENIFETDLFKLLIEKSRELIPRPLDGEKSYRIIADHLRASIFLIGDGVRPSKDKEGYILRRLIRRSVMHALISDSGNSVEEMMLSIRQQITEGNLSEFRMGFFEMMSSIYGELYPGLKLKGQQNEIEDLLHIESEAFGKKIREGISEYYKSGNNISGKRASLLHQSYGFPIELIRELAIREGKEVDEKGFDEESRKHQEKSRAGAEKKFGGHGLILDTGELKASNEEELVKVTRLHTATHMLHASLRKVLGEDVHQAGSDITAERLRFDFTFPRKLTPEEIKQVEDLVNEGIKEDLTVTKQELPYEEAVKTGALSFFKLKYPPKVSVYSVGNFSKELCGGPHVTHSGEIGHFKITKEEASSAGVRRIRAVVDESR